MAIPVAKEVFYKVSLERSQAAWKDLEHQLVSVGIILPEKAKMLVRGALFRHSIKESVVHLKQMSLGQFDFAGVIELTEPDLMEWLTRQEFAIIEEIDPSRN